MRTHGTGRDVWRGQAVSHGVSELWARTARPPPGITLMHEWHWEAETEGPAVRFGMTRLGNNVRCCAAADPVRRAHECVRGRENPCSDRLVAASGAQDC